MKKIVCTLLVCIICIGVFSGCAVIRYAPIIGIAVADSATKILRDDAFIADDSPSLTASMARNEYESMQFIVNCHNRNIKVESITASDLLLEGGSDKISTDNIVIYRQHYMFVDLHYHTYDGYPDGYYPDALIEMKYDYAHYENGFPVVHGQNQGYWISVYSAADQTPGIYKGNVTAVISGQTFVIPVKCEVYNFNISEDAHIKSYAGLFNTDNYEGQLEQYYEFFRKYRYDSWRLPVADMASNEEYYEAANKYATDENVNSYFLNLNYRRGWFYDENNNRYYHFFDDFIEMTEKLDEIAPGKAYALINDEPDTTSPEEIEELLWFGGVVNDDLKKVKSMITTDIYIPSIYSAASELRYMVDAWCIKPSYTIFEDIPDLHEHGVEFWWYTCNWPVYPAMNHHIDSHLIVSRTMSWMEYDYDVDGYFLWAATQTNRRTNDTTYPTQDNWTNPYSEFEDPAGDGYVALQGRQGDGIIDEDVPVPTIRLEALRDGMEDYEYLYNYEQKIKAIADNLGIELDTNAAMQMFYDAIYNGTIDFSTDTNKLLFTRNDLAKKICDDADFIYYIDRGSSEYDSNQRTVYVFTDGTKPVTIDGKTVTGENGKYSLKLFIDETKYLNEIKITVGDKEVSVYCFPDVIKKSVNMIDFDAEIDNINADNRSITCSAENGVLQVNYENNKSVVNIPFDSLTKDIDFSEYNHIRVRVSNGNDGSALPEFNVSLSTALASSSIKVKSYPSGSYIDIPLTDEFIVFSENSPTRLKFTLGIREDITLFISEMQLINKEIPELTDCGM